MLSIGPPGSLDSSLKKHTTLINKLKSSLLIGPAEALIKDIDGLTLTKYLDEIVAAVVEGAAKKGDPEVAVDVSKLFAVRVNVHPSYVTCIGNCPSSFTAYPRFSSPTPSTSFGALIGKCSCHWTNRQRWR